MTPGSHQPRLTRRFAYAVASVQFGAAITGLAFGSSHFQGYSYRPAEDSLRWLPWIDPSIWWSILFAVLSAGALLALRFGTDRATRVLFALLAAYWVWWTALYACAWVTPGAGPWAPWLAAMCVIGNSRPVIARTLASN